MVEAAIDGIGETVRGGGHKSRTSRAHRLNILSNLVSSAR